MTNKIVVSVAMQVYVPEVVEPIRALYSDAPVVDFEKTAQVIDAHARILFDAYQAKNEACVMQLNNWHPELISKDSKAVFNYDLKLDDARWALSRECGYATWDDAVSRSEDIDSDFENAVDMALAGNISELYATLSDKPDLVQQASAFGHRATILLYLGSNGVELWRQVVPSNICDIVAMLIELGANPDATANVYGGEFDCLALAESSAHPKAAGVRDQLLDLLKQHCTAKS